MEWHFIPQWLIESVLFVLIVVLGIGTIGVFYKLFTEKGEEKNGDG